MALPRGKVMVLRALAQLKDQECQIPENTSVCEKLIPMEENVLLSNIDIPNFSIEENIIIEEIAVLNNSGVEVDMDLEYYDQNSNDEDGMENPDKNEDNTYHPDYDYNPLQDEECNNNDQNDPDYIPPEDDTIQEEFEDDPAGSQNHINENNNPDSDNGELENADKNQEEMDEPLRKKIKLVTREERTKNKYLRMRGKSYKGLKKDTDGKYKLIKEVAPRSIGPTCLSQKCLKSKALKCKIFTEREREEMFKKFWEELTWDMKRTYISSLVDTVPAKRKKAGSRRKETLIYTLKRGTEKIRVCKKMFLSTLGVKEWTVRENSRKEFGMHVADAEKSIELRKRHCTKEKKKVLTKFLEILPKMPSHYCRASTTKLYLEPVFQSKMDLYREYKKYCEKQGHQSFSEKILMDTLKEKNVKLYRPRKDQCDVCIGHKLGNVADEIYSSHLQRKEMARSSKEEDKKACQESDGKLLVLTVDVQAVKLAPVLKASAIYYKTKLCVHNYTVYNLANGEVTCYLWDESHGGLEASNFATMLTDYLQNYILNFTATKEIIIYSDGCGYQNKNCVLSNALLKFSIQHQIIIFQKFFEKGHSQMEVDSVHSTIERRLKNRDIYLPTDYINVCREARHNNPYNVKYMNYDEFKDFSKIGYYSTIRPGYKAGDPKVSELHGLMYLPSGEIKYKINYDDIWKQFPKRPRSGEYTIGQLYKIRPKIKTEKYNHLQSLKSVLDKQFWNFYDDLPH